MNLESTGSSASSSNPPGARHARGSIAAQACETCRSRKQKCDEQRPKCGLCQRMKLECTYREPQPTKKDKTLVEILDRLKRLEGKVDQLPTRGPIPMGFGSAQPSPASQPSFSADNDDTTAYSVPSFRPSQQPSPSGTGISQPYRHYPAAHKILTWPAIQQLLLQSLPSNIGDVNNYEQDGATFLVWLSKGSTSLPLDEGLQKQPFLGMQTQATRNAGGIRMTFPALTRDVMHRLATSYFDTFNFMYPFMDRQYFMSSTLTKVHSEGFNGDNESVIALLVFALGELAIEGSRGNPINVAAGHPSGIRGGTHDRPPGLALFTEARRRIGFVLTECELENIQIYSLAALYYQSCFRHQVSPNLRVRMWRELLTYTRQDFWRMTVSASLACKVLVTCNTIDWSTPKGDLTKRAYWHCVIMETALNLELDLPLTGIISLEDRVGMPSFNAPFCEADHHGNQSSHFEAHYASQLALRRLCANLHHSINNAMNNSSTPITDESIPSASSLKQLAESLTQWRGMLPRDLQWAEDDPAAFPSPQPPPVPSFHQPLDPGLSPQTPSLQPLFTTDLDREPVHYSFVYDIQVALLRTRYYYAKYIVHRPYIYKALHFPDQMSQLDAEGVAECLRACIKWPLTLSPTSRQKRLVPYLFCWSQNFLGILLIFHMTEHNRMLRDIRKHLCGPRFEAEYSESIKLMLDWIQDLKDSDPIAMWCWKILQNIYHQDL